MLISNLNKTIYQTVCVILLLTALFLGGCKNRGTNSDETTAQPDQYPETIKSIESGQSAQITQPVMESESGQSARPVVESKSDESGHIAQSVAESDESSDSVKPESEVSSIEAQTTQKPGVSPVNPVIPAVPEQPETPVILAPPEPDERAEIVTQKATETLESADSDESSADSDNSFESDVPEVTIESEKSDEPEPPPVIPPSVKIDFDELQSLNPDIYAWLEIPDTVISYPIVQADGDNMYYLKHSYDRNYSAAGAIFTEDYNSKNFTDKNTVIYGHYMKDGTLFKGLHKFIDADFFTGHRYIYIHTPEKILSYKVFAVYPYDTRHLLMSFDYADSYIFDRVFEAVFRIRDMNACIADDVTLDSENDLVLTLSTCLYGDGKERLLLQAVLVD